MLVEKIAFFSLKVVWVTGVFVQLGFDRCMYYSTWQRLYTSIGTGIGLVKLRHAMQFSSR